MNLNHFTLAVGQQATRGVQDGFMDIYGSVMSRVAQADRTPSNSPQRTRLVNEARLIAKEGVRKWPNSATMHNAMGKLELVGRDYDRAVESFDLALQLNPELLDSLVSKSMALYFDGHRFAEAESWATEVVVRLNALGDSESLAPFKTQVAKIREQYSHS